MATEDFLNVRLATAGGIQYKLVHGYPVYEEDQEMCRGEEEYIIRASDVDAFLDEVMPQPDIFDGRPVLSLTRTMPGFNWVRTAKVRVEPCDATRPFDPMGVDPAAPDDTYGPLARVHLWYESMSDDIFEKSVQIGGEYLQIPPANAEVSENPEFSDPANDPDNPANPAFEALKDQLLGAYKLIPTAEWSYKIKRVLVPDWAGYFAMLGKVNDRVNVELCEGALPETVLFSGVAGSRNFRYYRRALRGDAWSLDFKLSQRMIVEDDAGGVARTYGWNHVYVPNPKNGTGEWRKLKRKNSGKFLYELADIASLFF